MQIIETRISTGDLLHIYQTLLFSYGHQGWWPSEGWFETIVGAILAQNVSWSGASKAISALKGKGFLSPKVLAVLRPDDIAPFIISSRFYNLKAARIINFSRWIMENFHGDISRMQEEDTGKLRVSLLSLSGFGQETVDSILLYACNKPVFVVDAYTRRIGSRIGWYSQTATYNEMQDFFMSRLSPDIALFNDFHAQFVHLGNTVCRSRPLCDSCPIKKISDQMFCTYTSGGLSSGTGEYKK